MKTKTIEEKLNRPSYVEQEHLDYLDELRESGETNMFGAQPYLRSEFEELDEATAKAILMYWMQSFGNPLR